MRSRSARRRNLLSLPKGFPMWPYSLTRPPIKKSEAQASRRNPMSPAERLHRAATILPRRADRVYQRTRHRGLRRSRAPRFCIGRYSAWHAHARLRLRRRTARRFDRPADRSREYPFRPLPASGLAERRIKNTRKTFPVQRRLRSPLSRLRQQLSQRESQGAACYIILI